MQVDVLCMLHLTASSSVVQQLIPEFSYLCHPEKIKVKTTIIQNVSGVEKEGTYCETLNTRVKTASIKALQIFNNFKSITNKNKIWNFRKTKKKKICDVNKTKFSWAKNFQKQDHNNVKTKQLHYAMTSCQIRETLTTR